MTAFQIVLIVVFSIMSAACIVAAIYRAVPVRMALFGLILSIGALAASIWPNLTTRLARSLGIGLGKDLVLYCAVTAMMVGFFMFYIRLRRLRREMTLLVRRIAIFEAEQQANVGQERS